MDNLNCDTDVVFVKIPQDFTNDITVGIALDRSIQILKIAEDKIRNDVMLNNIDINIGLDIGPIKINISRKIIV